jgi:hypothetical protein
MAVCLLMAQCGYTSRTSQCPLWGGEADIGADAPERQLMTQRRHRRKRYQPSFRRACQQSGLKSSRRDECQGPGGRSGSTCLVEVSRSAEVPYKRRTCW